MACIIGSAGLVYHAHQRPLTTPAAVLFDLLATVHAKVPRTIPTPSGILRSLGSFFPQRLDKDKQVWDMRARGAVSEGMGMGNSIPTSKSTEELLGGSGVSRQPSLFESMANALETPPIHVDHVADAIMIALDSRKGVRGIVGVQRMRELIGWSQSGGTGSGDTNANAVVHTRTAQDTN